MQGSVSKLEENTETIIYARGKKKSKNGELRFGEKDYFCTEEGMLGTGPRHMYSTK